MQGLHYEVRNSPIEVPEGVSALGVWVKPEAAYGGVSLRLVIQNVNGNHYTLPMGPPRTSAVAGDALGDT